MNQQNRNYNSNSNYSNTYTSSVDCCSDQNHVHELTGSTAVETECQECHNHRFCGVSGEAIRMRNSHVHEVKFRTDFADEHFHEYFGKTSTAISVGNGKHVHYLKDVTEFEDGHRHKFQVASLIDSPIDC